MRAFTPTPSSAAWTALNATRSSGELPPSRTSARPTSSLRPSSEPEALHAQAAPGQPHGRRRQPRPHGVWLPDSSDVTQEQDEHVLHDVVDVDVPTHHPIGQAGYIGGVFLEELVQPLARGVVGVGALNPDRSGHDMPE